MSSQLDILRGKILNASLLLKSIIQDIQECPGPMQELDHLNSMGREKITEIQKGIEDIKNSADELKTDAKLALLTECENFNEELSATVSVFKKATLHCMLHIEKTSRHELLGEDQEAMTKHRKKKDKEDLVGMSSKVTDRLLSISRTLADTTQSSADTLGTLVTSSGAVDGTREELDSQGNVISQSGKLLAKYGRREQTDKFLILFATAFFFACVAYVIQKRLF